MKNFKDDKIYLEFTPKVREWLKKKANEKEMDMKAFINQLISEQMNKENFSLESESNKYRDFIKEYLKIIRKF